jgi:hypothetical protein
MKTKTLISLMILFIIFSGMLFAQANYDFRSHPTGSSPHLWTNVSNWQYFIPDSAKWFTATSAPSSTNNVTIIAGDTISMSSAAISQCKNLTIESGAVLRNNNQTVSSPGALRVFGTTATIDGTLGKPSGDGIALETGTTKGNTLTISGAGTVDIAIIRINATHNTIVIGMNVNLYHAGSDGKEGYGLQVSTDSSAITINAGYTVAFAQNSGFSLTSSQNSAAVTATITVNGTLDLSQSGSNLILKSTVGDSATFIINNGGAVTVGGNFLTTNVTDNGRPTTITINGSGSLTCKGITDFSNPGMKVTGTGSFTLAAGGSLYIGDAAGITSSGTTGTIQTSSRSFNANATYAYMDTVAQVTGNALPSTVRGLIVNNKGGVTLTNAVTVDTTATFTNGHLTLGANNLILQSSVTLTGGSDTSFVVTDGAGVFTRNNIGATDVLFPIGTTSYSPVTLNNSGTADNFSVKVKGTFDNAPSDTSKVVKKQWTITEAVAGGTNATLKFQWKSSDQASAFNPNGSVAISRYAAGWQDVGAVITGTDPYIGRANGFSSFSNFIIQNSSLPSFQSVASHDFGAILTGSSKTDTIYVKNGGTTSLNLSSVTSDNARFTVTPGTASIAGGDSGAFRITFSPLVIGPLTGHIILIHNAAGSPDTITVSGMGLQSGATFFAQVSPFNFGDSTQIYRTKNDSLTIINTGTSNLTVDSVRVRLTSKYAAVETGPFTLASTVSKVIHLSFSPTDSSTQTGSLVFFSNASTTPDTVELIGKGRGVIVYSAGTLSGGSAWSNTGSWQGGAIPGNYDSVIIRTADSVYLAAVDTCYGVRVQSGGKLALSAKLRVYNMIVDGLVSVLADTLRPSDSLIIGSTGTYRHAENAGRVPTAYWADGSTCEFTGLTTAPPGNTFQSFYNVVMNSPGNTTNLGISWNSSIAGVDTSLTIRGNITTLNTGGARWQMSGPPTGTAEARSSAHITINGNIIVTGGIFTATGSGNPYTDVTVTVNGDVSVTGSGSQLSISRGSQGGQGTVTWYLKGNVTYGAGTTNQNSTEPGGDDTTLIPRGKFVFCKEGTQTVTLDSAIAWTGRCNMQFGNGTSHTIVNIGNSPFIGSANIHRIMPNAKVIIGDNGYLGGGTNTSSVKSKFYMENGGTMVLSSQAGLRATDHGSSGPVRVSGLRNYGTNANYIYNGTQRQRLGSGFPSSVGYLAVENAVGLYADTVNAFTINDSLAIVTTNLALDSCGCVATLGSSATLLEGEGHMCTGSLAVTKNVAAGIDETFKGIGLTLHATGTAPDTTTVTRILGVAQTGNATSSILRAYDIVPKVNTGLDATLSFSYLSGELNGQDMSRLILWKSTDEGTTWEYQSSQNDQVNHKLTASHVSSFSRWTVSDLSHLIGTLDHPVILNQGWNMVSVPYIMTDYRKSILFANATSSAFLYENGYKERDTLANMIGYWLKYPTSEIISFSGVGVLSDSVSLSDGWNMIGSISVPINVATIHTNGSATIASSFFGYVTGYKAVDTIVPGKGYWIKVTGSGKLYLDGSGTLAKSIVSPSDVVREMSSLTIKDANSNQQTLYFGNVSNEKATASLFELPPVGPEGMFDVRFASQHYAEIIPNTFSENLSHTISINGAKYPLTITWHVADNTELLYDLKFGSQRKSISGDGEVSLANSSEVVQLEVGNAGLIPKEFSLGNNYPNPFNPSTKFQIGVPQTAHVEITLFDVLGREVTTLFNGEQTAGYHTIEWNGLANNQVPVSSGIYFVKMVSGKFNSVHKIMLMK